jgi:hypothetical protein
VKVEEPVAEVAAAPEREVYQRREREFERPRLDRDRGRERFGERDRDRNGDNGPSVLGFGGDIPAFMLIRKRGPVRETEIEESDADVSPEETTNDTDIAA